MHLILLLFIPGDKHCEPNTQVYTQCQRIQDMKDGSVKRRIAFSKPTNFKHWLASWHITVDVTSLFKYTKSILSFKAHSFAMRAGCETQVRSSFSHKLIHVTYFLRLVLWFRGAFSRRFCLASINTGCVLIILPTRRSFLEYEWEGINPEFYHFLYLRKDGRIARVQLTQQNIYLKIEITAVLMDTMKTYGGVDI